jgi:hypothetical protein
MQTLVPEDALRRLQSIINRCFSENGKIPILRDEPIGLIKWGKSPLENFLISTCLKRRIRKRR